MDEKVKKTIYELGYLLKNDLGNKAVLEDLSKFSAEIVHSGEPKSIKLSYEIEKQESAQFGYIHFKLSDASKIAELTNALNMQSDILRFIIIKLPATKVPAKKNPPALGHSPISEPGGSEQFDNLSNEKLEEKLEEFVS